MQFRTEQPFNLSASLESGQSHRWIKEDEWYSSIIGNTYIKIRQDVDGSIHFLSNRRNEAFNLGILNRYFRMDDDISNIYREISADERVSQMVNLYPGLRLLRLDPWECLIAFICSANSNLSRIHQVMENMANHFGEPIQLADTVRNSFPRPQQLVEAGEIGLRQLGLGFRAPYVDQATRRVLEGTLDLELLIKLPYEEAKANLMECNGIGPKIADCVAVFSLEKLEAFPIDVWVRRALGEWYFPNQKIPPDKDLLEWAHGYFGPYAGYAQQYLFHGRRLEKKPDKAS